MNENSSPAFPYSNLISILRVYPGKMILTVALLACAALCEIAGISSLAPVAISLLDKNPNLEPIQGLLSLFGAQAENLSSEFLIALVIMAVVTRGALLFSAHILLNKIGTDLEFTYSNRALSSALRSKITALQSIGTGRILDAVTRQPREVSLYIHYLGPALVGLVLSSIMILVTAWISPILLLYALIIGLPLSLVVRKLSAITNRVGVKIAEFQQQRNRDAIELIHYSKFIKACALENSEISRFSEVSLRIRNALRTAGRAAAFTYTAPDTLVVLGICLLVSMLAHQSPEAMSSTHIVLSLLLIHRSFHYLNQFNSSRQSLSLYGASLNGLEQLISITESEREFPEGINYRSIDFTRSIEFRNVSFKYHDGKEVLKQLSGVIRKGSLSFLIGPSGAGKSTAIDMLVGLLRPTAGEILIDGTPLTADLIPSWREKIAYVSQEVVVFDGTIRENLLRGLAMRTEEEILQAVRRARFEAVIQEKSEGLDAPVGDRGTRLSGGQRQRLALARAFLAGKEIIILDEATNAVDRETSKMIIEELRAMRGHITAIVVTHDHGLENTSLSIQADSSLFSEH